MTLPALLILALMAVGSRKSEELMPLVWGCTGSYEEAQLMRKYLVRLSIVGLLCLPFGVAQAKQTATPAAGTFTGCETVTSQITEPGGVIFANAKESENWLGTFSGKFVGTEVNVIYSDGSLYFTGTERFTGKVHQGTQNGTKSGHFVLSFWGFADSSGTFHGHWVAGGGSQGLLGLHGRGTFNGQGNAPTVQCAFPYSGNYSGQVQFDG